MYLGEYVCLLLSEEQNEAEKDEDAALCRSKLLHIFHSARYDIDFYYIPSGRCHFPKLAAYYMTESSFMLKFDIIHLSLIRT